MLSAGAKFTYGLAQSIQRDAKEIVENSVDATYLFERLNRIYKKSEMLTRRMVEENPELGKPRDDYQPGPLIDVLFCCYCNDKPATGRFCFVGRDHKVLDNPFCQEHRGKVYEQTHRALGVLHSTRSVHREYTAIQLWKTGEQPPPLPKSEAELIVSGSRTYENSRHV